MQVNFSKKCAQAVVAFSLGFATLVMPHVASAACGDPVDAKGTIAFFAVRPERDKQLAATLTVPDCGVGKVTLVYKGPDGDVELVGDLHLSFDKYEPEFQRVEFVAIFKDPSKDDALILAGHSFFYENQQNFNGALHHIDKRIVVTSNDIKKLFKLIITGDMQDAESTVGYYWLNADVLAPMFKVPTSAPVNQ